MISFYPGPSKVFPFVKEDMQEAFDLGVLGINHRSSEFVGISKSCLALLKEKLEIPDDFTIFFTSSATECWEIIAQSLIKEQSLHIYNGAFGQKWFEYTHKLKPMALKIHYDINEPLKPVKFENSPEIIAIVQNETSNATQISNDIIKALKRNNPNSLIAVDVTSSLGGIKLDFVNGDIWFASVQKCLGLPAGLGIMICAPQVKKRVVALKEISHYNSLYHMYERMENFQTTYTPNVLGIYLLMKAMQRSENIQKIENITIQKSLMWYQFLQSQRFDLLVKNLLVRSDTVIAVSTTNLEEVKSKALKNNIILGNGYGDWASSTFRIANFPAHTLDDMRLLMNVLEKD